MDDVHFLERLPERVTHAQMDLALELYRSPELVRFLFEVVKPPPAFATMAIALDHSPEPPWVVVAPNGKFITCLGSGMVPARAYRLEKSRLDKLAEKHERLAVATRYAETMLSEPRTYDRLWHTIANGGHRVTREAMVALLPMANLIAPRALHRLKVCLQAVVEANELDLPRLAEREGRLRSQDEVTLDAYWRDIWCISHMLVLLGASERETLISLGSDGILQHLVAAGMLHGLWPVSLRAAWFAGRVPARSLVPELSQLLGRDAGRFPAGPCHVMALAFIGVAQKHVARQEVRSVLAKYAGFSEEDAAPVRHTGRWARILGEALTGPCDVKDSTRAAILNWRQGGSDDHRLERVRWVNQITCTWTDPGLMESLPGIIGWAARAPAENLYPTAAQRDEIASPWSSALPYPWLRKLKEVLGLATKAPVRYDAPKIGRNDPCPCNSGKKHKKCCGG